MMEAGAAYIWERDETLLTRSVKTLAHAEKSKIEKKVGSV